MSKLKGFVFVAVLFVVSADLSAVGLISSPVVEEIGRGGIYTVNVGGNLVTLPEGDGIGLPFPDDDFLTIYGDLGSIHDDPLYEMTLIGDFGSIGLPIPADGFLTALNFTGTYGGSENKDW